MKNWLSATGRWGAISALTLLQFLAWITGALALTCSLGASAVGDWAERNIEQLRDRRWLIPAAMVSGLIWVGFFMGVAKIVRWVLA